MRSDSNVYGNFLVTIFVKKGSKGLFGDTFVRKETSIQAVYRVVINVFIGKDIVLGDNRVREGDSINVDSLTSLYRNNFRTRIGIL